MKKKVLTMALLFISVLTAKSQNECGEYIDQYVLPPIMTSQGLSINLNADYAYSVLGVQGNVLLVPPTLAQVQMLNYGANGYAQPYRVSSDTTTTHLMGISVYKHPYLNNTFDSFITVNDAVGILNSNGSVLYEHVLTQNAQISWQYDTGGCPFFEIYFESPITVVGDYYVFYSYAEENLDNSDNHLCLPRAQTCFPLTFLTSPNYTPNDQCFVRLQGFNYWMSFSEFKIYVGYPDSDTVFARGNNITSDLAIFPILYIDTTNADTNVVDTSSLANIEINRITMYPNPAKEEISINSKSLIEDVDIFDQSGKMILSKDIRSFKGKVNIKHLKQGTYIVRINTINGSVNKKLVVE